MDFKHGKELTDSLRKAIKNKRIDAAVAFWGRDAFDLLGLESARAGSRVICDAYSGACNPTAIKALLDADFKVYDQPGLHAKVYICGKTLIVGSANASANGLGEEDGEINAGLEAALLTTEPAPIADAKAWFEKHIDPANKLGPDHLGTIGELWKKRRQGRPPRSATLEDAILRNDRTLKDRRFFAFLYQPEELPSHIEKRFKSTPFYDRKTYDPDDIPFFWDAAEWPCQPNDLLLSFEVVGGNASFDGMSRVQARIDDGIIIPVEPVKRPLGLRFSKLQGRAIAKRVSHLLRESRIKASGELIAIAEFAALLASEPDGGIDTKTASHR